MGSLEREGAEQAARTRPAAGQGRVATEPGGARSRAAGPLVELQRLAGNRAVAGLLGSRYRTGPARHRAAQADVEQTVADAAEAADSQSSTEVGELGGTGGAEELAAGTTTPSTPTSSFTKVGPATTKAYTVSGTLRKASETVAARTEAGATVTTPDLNSADDGTRMKHAQVTVTQEVELPDWSDRGSATANQQAEWDRFKAAITAHENGHVALDVKAYANAHTKILAKPTIAESDAEFDRISTQATADNDAYDTANDHGRKAGTTLNPNIDEVTKVP